MSRKKERVANWIFYHDTLFFLARVRKTFQRVANLRNINNVVDWRNNKITRFSWCTEEPIPSKKGSVYLCTYFPEKRRLFFGPFEKENICWVTSNGHYQICVNAVGEHWLNDCDFIRVPHGEKDGMHTTAVDRAISSSHYPIYSFLQSWW